LNSQILRGRIPDGATRRAVQALLKLVERLSANNVYTHAVHPSNISFILAPKSDDRSLADARSGRRSGAARSPATLRPIAARLRLDREVRWKYHTLEPFAETVIPTTEGTLFTGDFEGNLLAFDSTSGELPLNVGGHPRAAMRQWIVGLTEAM
jgi:hypothetical protein